MEISNELHVLNWSGIQAVVAILSVLLSALLLVGLWQGKKTLKESRDTRDADILRWTMDIMSDLKKDIKIVTDEYKTVGSFNNNWSSDAVASANKVSIQLQRIGYMANNNLISKEHFKNLWGPMYLSTWWSLEEWVKKKRESLNEPREIKDGGYSRMYFEEYALFCENNLPEGLIKNEKKRFNK
ncbi:hypothetical protein [Sulfurimonas sp.]